MPRYHFHTLNGRLFRDMDGEDLADDAAARRKALMIMGEVLRDGGIHGDTLTGTETAARETFAALEAVGIDMDDVVAVLEREGVEKFVDAWQELLDSMTARLA